MFGAAVNQLFVDLIGNHNQVVLLHDLGQLLQRFPGLHCAGGVAGGVHHQHLGPGGDEALDLGQIQLVVILLPQLIGDRLCPEEVGHVDIVQPNRVRHQDLVPLIEKGGYGGIGALAHTDGHQDLVGDVGDAVVPLELVADGFAQLIGAVVGGVKDVSLANALIQRLLDDLGGIKVRAADLHMDDVRTLPLHLIGPLHHNTDAGEGQHLHAFGRFKHAGVLLCRVVNPKRN